MEKYGEPSKIYRLQYSECPAPSSGLFAKTNENSQKLHNCHILNAIQIYCHTTKRYVTQRKWNF